MNYENKISEILDSYINGQREQCKEQFKRLPKTERKEMIKNAVGRLNYCEDRDKINQIHYVNFLIATL